jgi:hypothetical protein
MRKAARSNEGPRYSTLKRNLDDYSPPRASKTTPTGRCSD